MEQNIKQAKGITLIALVITIIVMLILVGVTINIAIDGGLFDYARTAANGTDAKKEAEKDYTTLEGSMSTDDLIDKYTTYGTVYTAYTIGQTVTINGESFYVIEDSDETKSTVKLLAAKCVDTREKIEGVTNPNYNKQSDNANLVMFDSTAPYSNIYADSTIKLLVDSYVASLGVTVKEGRLIQDEERNALFESGHNLGIPVLQNFWERWSEDEANGSNEVTFIEERILRCHRGCRRL